MVNGQCSMVNVQWNISEASNLLPDLRGAYDVLNRVFMRCLDSKTRFVRMRLVGPFAKTDYLLKEYHADPQLSRAVNDTRCRLRFRHSLSDEELEAHFENDKEVIRLFLELLDPPPPEAHPLPKGGGGNCAQLSSAASSPPLREGFGGGSLSSPRFPLGR